MSRGRRSFPNASSAVAAAREAAEAVSNTRPLLEQGPEIDRFFMRAADAVRALR